MPVLNKVVPPEAEALLKHLEESGTGKPKIEKLRELALVAKSGQEFLDSAKVNVPAATYRKIAAYVNSHGGELETLLSSQEGKRVESRSDNQSSIPERTVTNERRAPTLGKVTAPGVTQSRQLGADVLVKDETEGGESDEGGEEGSEGSESVEEKSPVADQPANEAKDAISRMTSKDKLEQIALLDERVTVKKAAEDRLAELK